MKSTILSTNQVNNLFSIFSFEDYNLFLMGERNKNFIEANSSGFLFAFALDRYIPYVNKLSISSHLILKDAVGKTLNFQFPEEIFYDDYQLQVEDNNIKKDKILEVFFKLRDCTIGEYFDFNDLKCLPCQPGFYSFQKNFLDFSLCTSCALENFFCYGGFNLSPKKSFWRMTDTSTNFIKCPSQQG